MSPKAGAVLKSEGAVGASGGFLPQLVRHVAMQQPGTKEGQRVSLSTRCEATLMGVLVTTVFAAEDLMRVGDLSDTESWLQPGKAA